MPMEGTGGLRGITSELKPSLAVGVRNLTWPLGSNPSPLCWEADSYPLYQQGSPRPRFESTVKNSLYEM